MVTFALDSFHDLILSGTDAIALDAIVRSGRMTLCDGNQGLELELIAGGKSERRADAPTPR
jgi:hypothetical protein